MVYLASLPTLVLEIFFRGDLSVQENISGGHGRLSSLSSKLF